MAIGEILASGDTDDRQITDHNLEPVSAEIDTSIARSSPRYITQRRRLLGPVADITHPEFGRENRPEETFKIFYQVRETYTQVMGADSQSTLQASAEVAEYIFDHENRQL